VARRRAFRVTWETKPTASRAGSSFSCARDMTPNVSDAVERGRAPGALSGNLQDRALLPHQEEAWELFRIGPLDSYASEPAKRRAHAEGTQFPVEAFDQFAKQGIPRWATKRRRNAGRLRCAGAEGLPLRHHRPAPESGIESELPLGVDDDDAGADLLHQRIVAACVAASLVPSADALLGELVEGLDRELRALGVRPALAGSLA